MRGEAAGCNHGYMFHPEFFLATAASAPVIALAAVVALRDALAPVDTALALGRTTPGARSVLRTALASLKVSYLCATYNLIAQTGVLAYSLYSLSARKDIGWHLAVVVAEAGGVPVLCIGLVAGMFAGRIMTQVTLWTGGRTPSIWPSADELEQHSDGSTHTASTSDVGSHETVADVEEPSHANTDG